MKWRKARTFFSFTRSEREGVISLLVLLLLIVVVKRIVSDSSTDVSIPSELQVYEYIHAVEEEERSDAKSRKASGKYKEAKKEERYFKFDPNVLNDEGWIQLGLSKKQVSSLRKYQSYGVRFSSKEDLKKVYVLDSLWLERHWDDVEIQMPFEKDEIGKEQKVAVAETKVEAVREVLELNSSDTLTLKRVIGIGAYSARRIIKFRDALGGFHSLEQLKEVYGLHPDTYFKVVTQLSVRPQLIIRRDINELSADSLRKHPYISWKVANAIVKYREQHGKYSDISELNRLHLISDSLFLKLEPYLSIGYDH